MKALFTIAIFAVSMNWAADCLAGEGEKEKEKQKSQLTVKDVSENRVMFLNGANFDFSGKLAPNYVGHFNILAPDIDKSKRWGFNTGIMKLNYFNFDTLQETTPIEDILLDPLYPKLKVGDKYIHQRSKQNSVMKNTVWSFYVQPMFRLTQRTASKSAIYIHAHAELLAKKYAGTTTVKVIRSDTLTVGPTDTVNAILSRGDQFSYRSTSLDGYFGLGATFDLFPTKNSSFFFQTTFGITTDSSNEVNGAKPATASSSRPTDPMQPFYLFRAYYTHIVNKNATLNIGTDIRGILPKFDPLYAAYIGVNVNMQGVLNLFGLGGTDDGKIDEEEDADKHAPKNEGAPSAMLPGEREENYDR